MYNVYVYIFVLKYVIIFICENINPPPPLFEQSGFALGQNLCMISIMQKLFSGIALFRNINGTICPIYFYCRSGRIFIFFIIYVI